MADLAWHEIFGIEQNTAALLSPSHLMLLIGGALILSSPFRAGWMNPGMQAPRWREFAPAFLSLAITMGAVCFFLMYAWMFRSHTPMQYVVSWYWDRFHTNLVQEDNEARGLSVILLNTALFMLPVLLLIKRWKLPFGTMTAMFGMITTMMNVLDGFIQYRSIFVAMGAGLIGDLLYAWLKPDSGKMWAVRLIAFVVPASMWLIYYILMMNMDAIGWEVELWTGSIVEAGLASVGLSLLAISPRME